MELGLKFDEKPTWETCDSDYKVLQAQLQASDLADLVEKPFAKDPTITLIGAVLTEAISAAYWSDSLLVRSAVCKWSSTLLTKHLVLSNSYQNGGFPFKMHRNISPEWSRICVFCFHRYKSICGSVIWLPDA